MIRSIALEYPESRACSNWPKTAHSMRAAVQFMTRKTPQMKNIYFESVHGAMKRDMDVKPNMMTLGFKNCIMNPSAIRGTFSCKTCPPSARRGNAAETASQTRYAALAYPIHGIICGAASDMKMFNMALADITTNSPAHMPEIKGSAFFRPYRRAVFIARIMLGPGV